MYAVLNQVPKCDYCFILASSIRDTFFNSMRVHRTSKEIHEDLKAPINV